MNKMRKLVVSLVGFSALFAQAKPVEVMTIYYPHWHQYPKGDEWFGAERWKEGEWAFVKDSIPRFPGHKWPIKPLPGYLNGKDPKDVATEIALAANAGIDVFLYDYYYYDGQITQQEAIEEGFLKAPNRDKMKFALMWCYHDRTAGWRPKPGADKPLLMGRKFVKEELVGLIDYSIAHYFNHPEYWRKDGKLFFSIYNAHHFIDKVGAEGVKWAVAESREHVRKAGFGELEFNAQNIPFGRVDEVKSVGFDSLTNYGCGAPRKPGADFSNYGEIPWPLRERMEVFSKASLPYYPVVSTGYDTSARCRLDEPYPWRKPANGNLSYPYAIIPTNITPETFELCLREAKAFAEKSSGVVYINAWNEYTEGGYLLPTIRDSDAMLRAVGRVFGRKPADKFVYCDMKKWWQKDAPNAGAIEVDMPTHENVKYGPHMRQAMDVWLPFPPSSRGVPTLVNIHGGGWTSGDRMCGIEKLLANCRKRGFALVTLNYRLLQDGRDAELNPPVQAPMEDVVSALRYVRNHAVEWGLDPTRIALHGGSAGACSILYAALQNDCELGICSAILNWPQTSLDPVETRQWIPNATYGASAFGYPSFDSWVAHRAECLPWIEKFSGAHLLRKCTACKAPKFFFNCDQFLKPGELPKDPTHAPNFCERFAAIASAKDVFCRRGTLDDALDALTEAP